LQSQFLRNPMHPAMPNPHPIFVVTALSNGCNRNEAARPRVYLRSRAVGYAFAQAIIRFRFALISLS
jgi:hypothetical protein